MADANAGEVDGLKPFLKELRGMSPEMIAAMKKASEAIALTLVVKIKARAALYSPQASLAVQNVRAGKTQTPTIRLGGKTKVTRSNGSKVVAGDVFFGADFGSNKGKRKTQFPQAVKGGHVTWPTIAEERPRIVQEYQDAMDKVLNGAFPN